MAHRIGLVSDVHGNFTALQAVIADAAGQGVTEYWLLGDIIMPGPGTQDLFDLIDGINVTACVLGNWDDYFLATIRGDIKLDDASDVYAVRLAEYVYAGIGEAGARRITEWPLSTVRQVEGLRISLSHNLPTCNYGSQLMPFAPQENFDHIFDDSKADIAVIGHTHESMLRYSTAEQIIVNPGSVGQAVANRAGDLRAQYAVLAIDERGIVQVDFRRVAFDTEAELVRAERQGLPYLELYRESLETGHAHTHDLPLLQKLNERFGYQNEAANFLASRTAGDENPAS